MKADDKMEVRVNVDIDKPWVTTITMVMMTMIVLLIDSVFFFFTDRTKNTKYQVPSSLAQVLFQTTKLIPTLNS